MALFGVNFFVRSRFVRRRVSVERKRAKTVKSAADPYGSHRRAVYVPRPTAAVVGVGSVENMGNFQIAWILFAIRHTRQLAEADDS